MGSETPPRAAAQRASLCCRWQPTTLQHCTAETFKCASRQLHRHLVMRYIHISTHIQCTHTSCSAAACTNQVVVWHAWSLQGTHVSGCSAHLQVRQPCRGLVSSGAVGQTPSGHDVEYLGANCAGLPSDHAGSPYVSTSFLCHAIIQRASACAVQALRCTQLAMPWAHGQPASNPKCPTHQGRRPMRVM